MEEQFVTYEIAKILKEKGFNEPCFASQSNIVGFCIAYHPINDSNHFHIVLPMWQQVIDWFRNNKNIIISIHLYDREDKNSWKYEITRYDQYELLKQTKIKNCKIVCSYYNCLNLAIKEALNFI